MNGNRNGVNNEEEDESMDAADIAALDAAESSFNANQQQASSSSATATPANNGIGAGAGSGGKKKTKITYVKYMSIMSLIVLHIADQEQGSGEGVEKEELIQWYLEQKEEEFANEEDMERERELITKCLPKLAKVSHNTIYSLRRSSGFVASRPIHGLIDRLIYLRISANVIIG